MPPYSKVLSETTQITYHQQEYRNYCGAACAQMVLHSLLLSPSPPAPPPSSIVTDFYAQHDLLLALYSAAQCDDPHIYWASAPDAITTVLNVNKPQTFNGQFYLFRGNSEQETTRRIIWNIENFNRAAIALVHGFQHWVVVRGFLTSKQPLAHNDQTYQILGLDIYDPSPVMPDQAPGDPPDWPPPHTMGDTCPLGNYHGNSLNHIPYDTWTGKNLNQNSLKSYMSGIPGMIASPWSGAFLAVCIGLPGEDPMDMGCAEEAEEEVEEEAAAFAANKAGTYVSVEDTAPEDTAPGAGERGSSMDYNKPNSDPGKNVRQGPGGSERSELSFDPKTNAQQGLEASGLLARLDWKPATTGTTAGEPLWVERLDSPGSFYLIVPFESARGIPLMVSLDAATGKFLQAEAITKAEGNVHPILSSQEIKARLVRGPVRVGDRAFIVRPDQLLEEDLPLVWKPCLESFSPFVPFYMATLEERGDSVVLYIRASDGAQFSVLTENIGGA